MGRQISGRLTDRQEVGGLLQKCVQQAGTSLIVFPFVTTDRQWGQKDREPGVEQASKHMDR